MGKSLSKLKARLMNSIAIKLHMGNVRSRSVCTDGRDSREYILKIFVADLTKSDRGSHIMKFFSQRNIPPKITLVKV